MKITNFKYYRNLYSQSYESHIRNTDNSWTGFFVKLHPEANGLYSIYLGSPNRGTLQYLGAVRGLTKAKHKAKKELYDAYRAHLLGDIMIDLLHGDCLELMKQIPDNSVDMVLTDPPYGTTACKWDSVIPFEPMWKELKRITKDNGAIALFSAQPFTSALVMSNPKMYKYDWYWNKVRSPGGLQAKIMPLKIIEIISIFYQKTPKYYPIMTEGKPFDKTKYNGKRIESLVSGSGISNNKLNKGTRYPVNIQTFSQNWRRQDQLHQTQKPIELLEYLIKTYTLEGETVLDFTMGSGSTGVAAKNLGRSFIGIEQDDYYFEIAKCRIEGDTERLEQLKLERKNKKR